MEWTDGIKWALCCQNVLGQCDWSGLTIGVWVLMLMELRGPGITEEGHGSMGSGGP